MDESYDFMEELEGFLGGTFHQDINSPEQALEEFINEASKNCLLFTIKHCEQFLNCDLTKREKESIIQDNAEIDYPAIELSPLPWLNQIVEQIKEGVKTK